MNKEYKEVLPNFTSDEAMAVTLTLKQTIWHDGIVKRLDRIEATKNLREFLNRLNRLYFGNKVKRYNQRLDVFPILEKSYDGRLHYHLTIRNPEPENPELLDERIRKCWEQTYFGDRQIDVQQTHNVSGWNAYISKRLHQDSEIDWENYSNSPS